MLWSLSINSANIFIYGNYASFEFSVTIVKHTTDSVLIGNIEPSRVHVDDFH